MPVVCVLYDVAKTVSFLFGIESTKKATCVLQCSNIYLNLNKIKILMVVDKDNNNNWMFTAIDAASLTTPYLTRYISSSCLLFVSFMMSLKQ